MRGVLPMASYLHVPGHPTFSTPVWLMMGSAFLLSTKPPFCTKRALHIVTARHNLVPWEYFPESKLPEDLRKARYIIAKAFTYNEVTGDVNSKTSFDLRLCAMHPTKDIALLSVKDDEQRFIQSLCELNMFGTAHLEEDGIPGMDCVLLGFKGKGQFGDPNNPQMLEKIKKMSKEEQHALAAQYRDAAGSQEAFEMPCRYTGESGTQIKGPEIGDFSTTDLAKIRLAAGKRLFSAMSGGPVVNGSDRSKIVGMLTCMEHKDMEGMRSQGGEATCFYAVTTRDIRDFVAKYEADSLTSSPPSGEEKQKDPPSMEEIIHMKNLGRKI